MQTYIIADLLQALKRGPLLVLDSQKKEPLICASMAYPTAGLWRDLVYTETRGEQLKSMVSTQY